MLHSGRVPQRLTKRILVTVSHAIERSALATAEDGPLVVVALFQRLPYFERERALYERIAATAAATVVAVVAPAPPVLPAGASAVLLDESEALAREWTVAVLTPRFGAVLVAYDRAEVEPTATSLEAGRLFDGWWGFRRDEALHEVLRLRRQLADRLAPSTRAVIDDVLGRVRDMPATPGETRSEAAIRLMADRAERAYQAGGPGRQRSDSGDETTVLLDEPAMARWSDVGGVTASGTLPIALIALRVREPVGTADRLGRRNSAREAQAVLATVTAALRPVDRAQRLAEHDYLLVLPSLTEEAAIEVARQARERLVGLSYSYPFVAFTVHAAVTVTARRPLPVADVRHALDWAEREGVPVATLVPEAAGVTAGRR